MSPLLVPYVFLFFSGEPKVVDNHMNIFQRSIDSMLVLQFLLVPLIVSIHLVLHASKSVPLVALSTWRSNFSRSLSLKTNGMSNGGDVKCRNNQTSGGH